MEDGGGGSFGPVFVPDAFPNLALEHSRSVVTWTLPPLAGVTVIQLPGLMNHPISAAGGSLELDLESTAEEVTEDGQTFRRVHVVGRANGEQFLDQFLANPGQVQAHIGLDMRSSGQYSVVVVRDGQELINDTYVQRALKFTQPFPSFNLGGGQAISIQNAFGWDQGEDRTAQEAEWSVTIRDPQLNTVATYGGTGPTIAFSWDPGDLVLARTAQGKEQRAVRLVPQGSEALAGDSEGALSLSYTVAALAHAPIPSGPFVKYAVTGEGGLPAQLGIRVKEPRADPEAFTQPQTTKFRAQLSMAGYRAPLVHYWLYVRRASDPPDAAPLWKKYYVGASGGTGGNPSPSPSPPSAGVFFRDINEEWDGTTTQGALVESGNYRFDLAVRVEEQGGGGDRTSQASATVALEGGRPRLNVSNGEDVLGFDYAGQPDDTLSDAKKDLQLQIFGVTDSWIIEANDLQFDGDPPDLIAVNVTGLVGNVTKPVNLTRVDPQHRNYRSAPLAVQQFVLQGTALKRGGQPVQTGYSSGLFIGNFWRNFLSFLPAQSVDGYPLQRVELGKCLEYWRVPDNFIAAPTIPDDEVDGSLRNLQHFGFEGVEVKLDKSTNPKLKGLNDEKLRAVVKVSHPGNAMTLLFHGGHSAELSLTQEARRLDSTVNVDVIGPGRAAAQFPGPGLPGAPYNLTTLVMPACQALDLNDYNNIYALGTDSRLMFPNTTFVAEHDTSDTLQSTLRKAPGLRWIEATGNSTTVLLGYNAPGPSLADIPTKYAAQLGVTGQSSALAWMKAHYEVGVNPNPNTLEYAARNACAFDPVTESYYYIAYDVPKINSDARQPRTLYGVCRVPANRIKTEAKDWAKIPQSTANIVFPESSPSP